MEESVEREEQESRLVCVVDDDLAILASSCALLESAGFRPVPYPSGAMLLDDDKYLHAGCIVLDLRMPPPDGIETLRRIRKSHQTVPVIMITGEGDIPTAVEAMMLMEFLRRSATVYSPGSCLRRQGDPESALPSAVTSLRLMAAKFGSTASLVPVRRSSSLCAGLIS